jgi:hypothetical protein
MSGLRDAPEIVAMRALGYFAADLFPYRHQNAKTPGILECFDSNLLFCVLVVGFTP